MKTEKDKIVVSMVKHLVLKLVILRILSHNYNKILIIPTPGEKAIINTLVTIQSFFYIFMFIFFENEICTVHILKAFKVSISVMGL